MRAGIYKSVNSHIAISEEYELVEKIHCELCDSLCGGTCWESLKSSNHSMRRRGHSHQQREKKEIELTDRTLLSWDEIEEWQRDNEFIRHGYVRAEGSFLAVGKSLGYLHNETGNIYSHLFPAVMLVFFIFAWEQSMLLFGIGCITCLGMSATFHTIKSHSHKIAIGGNKFDYVGICILIATSMISLLNYAFDDHPSMRFGFICLTSVLGSACTLVSLLDRFRMREWRPYRAAIFVAYGLSGTLPILAGSGVFGYSETCLRAGTNWLYTEAGLYIFGAALYALRFPEKSAPGRFDYLGHSHQIFHLFVVAAAYAHYRALKQARDYSLSRSVYVHPVY